MIYTFYSYKGGVGRSMALANIGELLYSAGLKVLLVDWDLEAPGLERFFLNPVPEHALDTCGVIDLIIDYQKLLKKGIQISEDQIKTGDLPFENPKRYLIDLHPDAQSNGKLWLLSAGRRSEKYLASYTNLVLNFNWKDFYLQWGGEIYFEWLRHQFENIADVVLIDSRTGLSEMGGVCTYQLADVVVMFCSAAHQSLDGTYQMLIDLKRPEIKESRGRDLEVLVIPARIEEAESDYLEIFHKDFSARFSSHTPVSLGSNVDALWRLGIPYKTRYAYKETLAVNDRENPVAQKITESFSQLTFALSRLAPGESPLRKAIPETQIKIGNTTVQGSNVGGNIVIAGDNNVITFRDSKTQEIDNLDFEQDDIPQFESIPSPIRVAREAH
jgi:cellulose biosynthesis protein BcsQ